MGKLTHTQLIRHAPAPPPPQASAPLQLASLGTPDLALSRSALSSVQRAALALVAAAGRRGALQNEMAAELRVETRNFFYVIKVGHVVRLTWIGF